MLRIMNELPAADYDVVVLGGGFAGAAASRRLTSQGLSVLVLEGRDRLSGRMWSEVDHFDSQPVEWGGAFMLDRATYPLVWEEIDKAGLPLAWPSPEPTELIWVSCGERRAGALPVPVDELASLETLVVRIREWAGLIDPGRPLEDQDLHEIDVPWSQLLSGVELGPHTVDIWRTHVRTLSGDEWDVPSAVPLLTSIAKAGSLAATFLVDAPYNTPMARTMGPQLAEGTGSLYDAVTAESDADVVLGCVVEAVRDDGDAVEVTTDKGRVRARACICALPISTLDAVDFTPGIRPELRTLAEEGVSGQAEKSTIYVSGCPRPFYGHGTPPGGGFTTASTTWHEGDRAVVVGFTPHAKALDLDDPLAVEAALQWYVPTIKVEAMAWHDWAGDRFARGTWSYLRPGQTALRPKARAPYGRVAFAGSDFDARMGVEGALYTGGLAADEVTSLLGG